MKRLVLTVVAVLVAVLATQAIASDKLLGAIISTTSASKTQASTATPFTLNAGDRLSMQCDVATYVTTGTTSAVLATSADVKIAADQLYDVPLASNETHLATLGVSATSTCKVFAVRP